MKNAQLLLERTQQGQELLKWGHFLITSTRKWAKYFRWGGSLKHSIHMLRFQPFCQILEPNVVHQSKSLPTAGLASELHCVRPVVLRHETSPCKLSSTGESFIAWENTRFTLFSVSGWAKCLRAFWQTMFLKCILYGWPENCGSWHSPNTDKAEIILSYENEDFQFLLMPLSSFFHD